MSKVQNLLVKTVQQAGAMVEAIAKVGQGSKKAKVKKTGIKDEEGEDLAQLPWDERHIQTLLLESERREIFSLIPELGTKKVLSLRPSFAAYSEELIQKRAAKDLIELDVQKNQQDSARSDSLLIRKIYGSVDHLPFRDSSFEIAIYPSALAWRSDLPLLIPELARCLTVNGRIVISIIHPFFEYLLHPRGGFRKNIGALFQELKKHGFFVEDLKEATLDQALKRVALPQSLQQELKKLQEMPVVLFLKAILTKKKGLS